MWLKIGSLGESDSFFPKAPIECFVGFQTEQAGIGCAVFSSVGESFP